MPNTENKPAKRKGASSKNLPSPSPAGRPATRAISTGDYPIGLRCRHEDRTSAKLMGTTWSAPAHVTDQLSDDCCCCAAWVDANDICVHDAYGQSLFHLTRSQVYKSLSVAAVALTNPGIGIVPSGSMEEFFAPDKFERIVTRCADYAVIRTLIQLAADWVQASTETLAQLEQIAREKIYY